MKHNRLKQALWLAKEAGLSVARWHREGKTVVTITSGNGESCGKAYTTGNASGQAGFISRAVKGWRLVETGTLHRYGAGVEVFVSERHGTTYAWNDRDLQWQVISDFNPHSIRYKAPVVLKVKVDVCKLASGIAHPDW